MMMEKEKLVSLVTAAQKGDSVAINELFNAFYEDIRYFALKTVKDEDLSYEITQEAFIEIINTLPNLKEPVAFVTWAKQITYHQCTRYFKKKKDIIVDEDEDGGTIFDDIKEEHAEFIPDEALSKTDFKATILAILDELSEEQRSATMMYYFDEMSVHDIAEVQGVSEGTVKSRLNYARKSIKQSVEEYEKKNNIKLHAFPFLPLVKWIFASEAPLVAESATAIAEGISAATGVSLSIGTAGASLGVTAAATTGATAVAGTTAATVTAGATTAATTVTTTTAATSVGIGAKIMALPLVTKIIAGVTAVAIAAGGTTAAVLISQNNDNIPADSDSTSSTSNVQAATPDKKPIAYLTVLEGEIPVGCVYTLHDGTVLKAGDKFPETCTRGDKVSYGDYNYGYECIYVKGVEGDEVAAESDYWMTLDESFDTGDSGVTLEDIMGCWTPAVKDRSQEHYMPIARSINGKEIRNLFCTFQNCKNMKTAPEIPSTVTSISMAFYRCSRLEAAPVIPKSVKRLTGAFQDSGISGDVVYNGELDKSTVWYYYSVVDGFSLGEINLTGEASEDDLQLIGENSDTYSVAINGKPLVRYYNTDRLHEGVQTLEAFCSRVRQFYIDEPIAGFSGDEESGEDCSVVYSAHAFSDHFATLDIFGYSLTEYDFMVYNTAYGDAHYTFTNASEMTSNYNLNILATLSFKTLEDASKMLERDHKRALNFFPDDDNVVTDYGNVGKPGHVDFGEFYKLCMTHGSIGISYSGSLDEIGQVNFNMGFGIKEVDGHYEYRVSYNINLPPEYMLS